MHHKGGYQGDEPFPLSDNPCNPSVKMYYGNAPKSLLTSKSFSEGHAHRHLYNRTLTLALLLHS